MPSNPRLLLATSSLHFVLFPIPVITLFWKDQIGMSLTDIMVLQAVFGMAVVVLEFPSGYLADRAGYRLSLLVGAALGTIGWGVYGLARSFAAVAAAEVLLGAGSAFMSGADRALLWVSLADGERLREYTRWEGRLRAAAQTSEAASAAAGGWLYAVTPRLPLWLQVPAAASTLLTALALRDPPRPPAAPARSHLARMGHIMRFTLWRHRRLQAAMALSVALGLSTFVMVWLIQPYMQSRGVPVGWFGPVWAAAHAWLAVVSLASGRVVGALGPSGTLLLCCLLVPVGYAGLAASASPAGVVFYLGFMTIRGLQGPTLAAAMQEDAPAEDRASVLSLAALLFRLAFVVAGPPIGALVDHAGMEAALGLLALAFTPVVLAALAAFARARA